MNKALQTKGCPRTRSRLVGPRQLRPNHHETCESFTCGFACGEETIGCSWFCIFGRERFADGVCCVSRIMIFVTVYEAFLSTYTHSVADGFMRSPSSYGYRGLSLAALGVFGLMYYFISWPFTKGAIDLSPVGKGGRAKRFRKREIVFECASENVVRLLSNQIEQFRTIRCSIDDMNPINVWYCA